MSPNVLYRGRRGDAMEREYGNIYADARRTAGLTQERWAELLGLSVDAVQKYEAGKILPSDEVVLRMAEGAGQWILCYWHLIHKSRVAGTVLPDVQLRTLPEAVLSLIVKINAFSRGGLESLTRLGEQLSDQKEYILVLRINQECFGGAATVQSTLLQITVDRRFYDSCNIGDDITDSSWITAMSSSLLAETRVYVENKFLISR